MWKYLENCSDKYQIINFSIINNLIFGTDQFFMNQYQQQLIRQLFQLRKLMKNIFLQYQKAQNTISLSLEIKHSGNQLANCFQAQQPQNFVQAISTEISYQTQKNQENLLYEQIQLHIKQQTQRIIKRTLFKQSIIKCSVDKDYAYLFQDSAFKFRGIQIQQEQQELETLQVEMNEHQCQIFEWLESTQQNAFAHLQFRSYLNLYKILSFKVEKLCIVVTNYHHYLSQKLQTLKTSKNIPIQWACLSTALPIDVKTKIFELYQLRKLKLLFITPELFQNQQYHLFQCELLIITDAHLYKDRDDLLHKIISKCSPERTLGLYQHLSKQNIKKSGFISLPRKYNFENYIWLKTENKLKTLINYYNKSHFKRILILVEDKKTAEEVYANLSLIQHQKVVNIYDVLQKGLIKNFTLPYLLTKKYKNQIKMLTGFQRLEKYNIIVSDYFDCLKLMKFDLVIHYNFDQFNNLIQKCHLGYHNCILLSEQDYFIKRNHINQTIFSKQILLNSIENILTKSKQNIKDKRYKRYYSQTYDELILQKFSISKQQYLYEDVKSIKVLDFCSTHQINRRQLDFLLTILEEQGYLQKQKNLSYEIKIYQKNLQQFQSLYPDAIVISRKINILNLSNKLGTTTKMILQNITKNNINYTIVEQIIPVKIKYQYKHQMFRIIYDMINQKVRRKFESLDTSYSIMNEYSISNLELLKKYKQNQNYIQIIKYLNNVDTTQYQSMIQIQESYPSHVQRFINIRQYTTHAKNIQIFLVHLYQQYGFIPTEHELIIFLLGITNIKTIKFREYPIFKKYQKYTYQDLYEMVHKLYCNKKVKII